MKQSVRRLLPTALVALIVLAAAPMAFAAPNVISAADFAGPDINVGYNTLVLGFATVSSINGDNFSKKTIAGFENVGAVPGVRGEFGLSQTSPQGMLVTYLTPQTVQSITLGFLYPTGVFGDTNNEVAQITFNGTTTYTLEATGATTFVWTGGGTVVNASVATSSGAGEWTITNPFVGAVSTIAFSPFDTGAGKNTANSDFGINAIVSAVPEPFSILLLGSAMALAVARKKLRHG